MSKRMMSVVLALAMVFGLFTVCASADTGVVYLLSKETVKRTLFIGSGGMEGYDFSGVKEYTYDAHGRLILEVDKDENYGTTTTSTTYDAYGNKILEDSGEDGKTAYTYDANGNVISIKNESKQWGNYEETYTYDSLNRVIQDVLVTAYETTTITYTYNGNEHEPASMKQAGSETGESAIYYTYDSDRRVLSETMVFNDGRPSTTTNYTYAEDGISYTKTDGEWNTRCVFDEHGNIIEETSYGPNGSDSSFTYQSTYDQYGNRIKLVEYMDDELVCETTYEYIEFKEPEEVVPGEFADVSEGAYYYDAVQWAVGKDITSGTSATAFSPDAPCTRAQAVTFLWRAEGCPAPKGSANKFADVPAGQYYSNAVAWAVENGIVNGTSDTEFSPNLTCNRAQIVTMLYRLAGSRATQGTVNFTDVPSGQYYFAAVQWAVSINITTGTTATTFGPNDTCIRAQIVTFLYRYYNPSSVTPAPAPGGNASDSTKIENLLSYAGITVNELRNRLGDYCLEEGWYLGAAKPIYYDKQNADGSIYYPIYFYYIDEDHTSNPRGDEIIEIIQYYPDSNDGVVEVAPGVSKTLTATELLSMGGEYEEYLGYELEDWCRYEGKLTIGGWTISFYYEDLMSPAEAIDFYVVPEG